MRETSARKTLRSACPAAVISRSTSAKPGCDLGRGPERQADSAGNTVLCRGSDECVIVDVVTPVVAAVAAVAGVGSWRASAKANQTGGGLAAIERGRRHDEVTPEFEITCRERGTSGDSADMRVSLMRGKLEGLDEVSITILDETGRDHWGRGLPDRFTKEAAAFVWGPWEFNTGASAQVISNRTARAQPYSRVSAWLTSWPGSTARICRGAGASRWHGSCCGDRRRRAARRPGVGCQPSQCHRESRACGMTSETEAALKATAARAIAESEARHRLLIAEYGTDAYRRGDVLVFRPHEDDRDQETRAAVKVGAGEWTLSGRGNRHSWLEILEYAGSGKTLSRVTAERPARVLQIRADEA